MTSALLVAAGSGRRFGAGRDKLFLEVAGRPVVAHTWSRFDAVPEIEEIVVVIRGGMESAFEEIAHAWRPAKPWRLVPGGDERQDSVWNGLQATAAACEIVVIQDAARPCTPASLIAETIREAKSSGAAVAARRITDTLKESSDGRRIERTVDRSRLWSVQTPQTFRRTVILRALEEVRRRAVQVTDDTAACECIGQAVTLVESAAPNPKVTYPEDLPYVEWLLRGGDRSGCAP